MTTNTKKITELIPDDHNANIGTERGLGMLEKSIQRYGMGRSVLIDKNGKVIAGNKTTERAAELGVEDVIIVPTDGTKLVAVQRTDLDLDTDEAARMLAYADNRVSEIDLSWNVEIVFDDATEYDLSPFFTLEELEQMREIAEKEARVEEKTATLVDQAIQLRPANEYVVIMCEDLEEFEQLKVALELKPVRRGGYKPGSQFDAVGIQRVIHAADLLERLGVNVDRNAE